MDAQEPTTLPPHVLIFPFPSLQGHLNSMLNLAHLLICSSPLHITFIVSEFAHRRLLRHTVVPSTFAPYPGFQFQPIPDGLPDDHPRAGVKTLDLSSAVNDTILPLFKKMMIQDNFFASPTRRPVTCFILDGLLGFAADFAEEMGIPLVYFRTASAAYFWASFHLTELIEAGEIPLRGNGMDELVKSVPRMEGLLRRRDLPRFFNQDNDNDPTLQFLATLNRQAVRAQAAIFNTFEDLEGPIVAEIRKYMPRTFTIGPIHALLKARLRENNIQGSVLSCGLWAEDGNCFDWLNQQIPKSVIYVSFGSITVVTREQLLELWYGLVNSGQRFLWVMRPNSIIGEDGETEIPEELMEGTKTRGFLVDWAPQEEVLNHRGVGGFLTHSGWNSTLESVVAGVPMICWPYFADQMVNSRLVSQVWKIGLDIKDTCDRLVVENAVRELMEVRKDEFQAGAEHMAKLAEKAITQGGSSYDNMDGFIEYINSLIIDRK